MKKLVFDDDANKKVILCTCKITKMFPFYYIAELRLSIRHGTAILMHKQLDG